MLSKNKAKFIKSLQIKKFRNEYKLFLVEGAKSVLELIDSNFKISELYVSPKFLEEYSSLLKKSALSYEVIAEGELSSISSFSTNNAALAVVKMMDNQPIALNKQEWAIALDSVQDPGNLGTIIRIADWYGITKIICSETTTDRYNPKVISSSMGSFTRVHLFYVDLENYLSNSKESIYAAHLEGEPLHQFSFKEGGILLMGNESEGISESLMKFVSKSLFIPRYGKAESLNVAIATAIICDSIRRTS